jgi:glycosyltransferase involved in cell wall biosynthesis
MGNGNLCNGVINPEKCEKCILDGRDGIGKINELLVNNRILFNFFKNLLIFSSFKKYLQSKYAVLIPINKRLKINFNRAEKIITKTDAVIVPYKFGISLFSNFTQSTKNIFVLPWFSDPVINKVEKRNIFTISYIGRVSPEKSLHIVLESLKKIPANLEIVLNITGKNSSQYCLDLLKKYPNKVNNIKINWLDWVNPSFIYNNSDIILVTTGCMECGPFTLFEALSYKVPVIATNIPPILEIVKEGVNGYLVDFNSSDSIADAILKAYNDFTQNKFSNFNFCKINTVNEYCIEIFNIYKRIFSIEK